MANGLLGMELRGMGAEKEKRGGISRSFCGDGEEDEMKRRDLYILLHKEEGCDKRKRSNRVRDVYPPRSIQGPGVVVRAKPRWSSRSWVTIWDSAFQW